MFLIEKFNKTTFKNFLILILMFEFLIVKSSCNPIDTTTSGEISFNEYLEYYNKQEEQRDRKRNVDQVDIEQLTAWEVFKPFWDTFWITILIVISCFATFLCVCIIQSIDWTTICSPLEYSPCQGYLLMTRRLERLKVPGLYVREDGTKQYYEPIVNELKYYNQILNRLETNN